MNSWSHWVAIGSNSKWDIFVALEYRRSKDGRCDGEGGRGSKPRHDYRVQFAMAYPRHHDWQINLFDKVISVRF